MVREFDLIPALINAAEDEANPNRDLVAATLLSLAETLYDELERPVITATAATRNLSVGMSWAAWKNRSKAIRNISWARLSRPTCCWRTATMWC